jgi:LysM repeat protein
MKLFRCLFLLPIMAVVLFGCVVPPPHTEENVAPPAAPPPPEYVLHKVMPGETFATIARWYSGKESNWHEIAEHNRELNPWNLQIGDIVKVPVYLTTLHNAQPDFSTAPHRMKRKVVQDQPQPPAEEEQKEQTPPASDEVFGPK